LLSHPFSRRWRAWFRIRYAEDCLAEAVARGCRQYLILGAGLDTFAYRQPAWARAIHIFEGDYAATQDFKRSPLAKSSVALPDNSHFCPDRL
jgi:O-methyltransferase involved in polyketide biosynthesis